MYNSFNQYLKERYGCKVWKISIDAGFTCPNRDGLKGVGGCTYCNVDSFSNVSEDEISNQIKNRIKHLEKRKIKKFIVYYQTYSNTYAPLNIIKKKIMASLVDERIVAIYIGTRPDCIDEEKIRFFNELSSKIDIVLEYGLQSIHNQTLKLINRGSTFEEFDYALKLTRKYQLPVCAHIILGLPGEDKNMMLETVKYLAKSKVEFVKFHHLHIVKDTKMHRDYIEGKIKLLNEDDYIEILAESISLLPKSTVIARLVGDADEKYLVAPSWPENKLKFLEKLNYYLKENKLYQGKNYNENIF
ncbi:TIGR01212 family radical SAM protein [Deferribacter thermophilus]|uniref:TIGR01212 family radical SAM protein n=1 Tax=Deferribacter thermophilus TaxID=53573 RepID=UPI003C1E39F5